MLSRFLDQISLIESRTSGHDYVTSLCLSIKYKSSLSQTLDDFSVSQWR